MVKKVKIVSNSRNIKISTGAGVPAEGNQGQFLAKKSDKSYDYEWVEGTQTIQTLEEVLQQGNEANDQIKNVSDPTDAQDVVTLSYFNNNSGINWQTINTNTNAQPFNGYVVVSAVTVTVPSMALGSPVIVGCGVAGVVISGDGQTFVLPNGQIVGSLTSTGVGNSVTLIKGISNTFGVTEMSGNWIYPTSDRTNSIGSWFEPSSGSWVFGTPATKLTVDRTGTAKMRLSQTTVTINEDDEAILNFNGVDEGSFYIPDVDQDIDILLTNATNALVFNAFLLVTGTRGVVFPSNFFGGDEAEWDNATKTLTLVGVTDTVFEISCTRISATGNWYIKFKEYVS